MLRAIYGFFCIIITSITLAYTAGLLLLVLAWQSGGAQHWALALSNILALYLFVPLPLLLLLTPVVRLRAFWLATATVTLLCALLFHSYLLPPRSVGAAGPTLRLLTTNVLYNNKQRDALAAHILAQQADVVLVQELGTDTAAVLDERLATAYPYRLMQPTDSWDGLGLLSRYPLAWAAPPNQRIQEVDLAIGGHRLRVINTHPRAPQIKVRNIRRLPVPQGFSTEERDAILATLLERIDAAPRPLVLAGDLNLSEREALYRALATRLDDGYARVAWRLGHTFPATGDPEGYWAFAPLVRIDYVWSSADLPARRVEVRCDVPGADHCAVLAELELRWGDGTATAGVK